MITPPQLRCPNCGYDILWLIENEKTRITCPECAHTVDPCSPHAIRAREMRSGIVLMQVSAAALIPGLCIALAFAFGSFLFGILAFIALLPAGHISANISDRALITQRKRISNAIAFGWGLGLFLGLSLVIFIASFL